LIAETHGRCFRLICEATDVDCEGLTYAARVARSRKLISDKVFKMLERIDVAFAVARHANSVRSRKFAQALQKMMEEAAAAEHKVTYLEEVLIEDFEVEDRDGKGGSTDAELMRSTTNLDEETTDEVDEVVGTAEVVDDVQGN
jgi:hypothetical protein